MFAYLRHLYDDAIMGGPIVNSNIWDRELRWVAGGFGVDNILHACADPDVPSPFNAGDPPGSEMQTEMGLGISFMADVPGVLPSDAATLTCADGADPDVH